MNIFFMNNLEHSLSSDYMGYTLDNTTIDYYVEYDEGTNKAEIEKYYYEIEYCKVSMTCKPICTKEQHKLIQ